MEMFVKNSECVAELQERDKLILELQAKLAACESENAALRTCMERAQGVLADIRAISANSSTLQVIAMNLNGALVDPRKPE